MIAGALRRRLELAGRDVAAVRPTWPWLRSVVRSFVISFAALAAALWVLPGSQVPTRGAETVGTLVVAVLLVGALVRPFVTRLAVLAGVAGLLVAGLLTQTAVLAIALSFVPAVEPIGWPALVVATWSAAVVAAVLNWVVDASSEEVYLAQVLGRAVRTARRTDVRGPGLLVVQLDGVAAPLLRQAAAAGTIPYLSGEMRAGRVRLREWRTGLPATTPAGQAALMHGDAVAVPGYRWYDRDRDRVLECGRPADVALAEGDLTTGRGLLADGGASVSNLMSGDAPLRALTVSHARLPGSEPGVAAFASARSGFARSVVLFAGQVLLEWYEARRQVRRDVVPRVHRGGSFLWLRGLTTVLLRDLAVSIVAEQLARGVPIVYVDLVDYDEVAHHAGPTRPEAMRTLEGLDRVLRFFAEVGAEVGRDYEMVVVSDHGQSQGRPFRQLEGRTLAEAVRDAVGVPVEERTGERDTERRRAGPDVLDDPAGSVGSTAGTVRVLVSGSLAHLYLPTVARPGGGAASRAEVEQRLPALLPALRSLGGVGVVVTRDDDALVVEDAGGQRHLDPRTGEALARGAEGDDPLAAFGDGAGADVAALLAKRHVGDVVLLGRYEPDLDEVAAFEELVGSHGGLGGWQTRAAFAHPAAWSVPDGDLDGVGVHRLLVDRLAELGLRDDVPAAPAAPAATPALTQVRR